MDRAVAISLAGAVLAATCLAAGSSFEAASVKISPADAPHPYTISGGPGTRDPGRFRAAHTSMQYLLQRAYGVQPDQIAGPSWIRDVPPSVNYQVAVTMPAETTKELFQTMLQNLLAERFHLTVHHEIRHFPGYSLVVDKGGPKLKEVTLDDDVPDRGQLDRPRGPDGFPTVAGPMMIILGAADHNRMKFQQQTMAYFAGRLGNLVFQSQGISRSEGDLLPRVIDMTGLTANYTFTLDYSCSLCVPIGGGHTALDGTLLEPGGGFPELFKAIQQQLGLRLEKKTDVSLDVIVVDSVDRTPTAN
jgi:uncharacterized protein (TIGR03435 family)